MRPTRLALLALAIVALARPAAADFSVSVILTGDQERPNPVSTPGTGVGTLDYDAATQALAFTLSWEDLTSDAFMAHIHVINPAAGNGTGPVVADFTAVATFSGTSGQASGTITPSVGFVARPAIGINTFDDFIAAIVEGRAYFNVHSRNFTAGEIRGNIPAVPAPPAVVLLGLGLAGTALGRRFTSWRSRRSG